MFCNVTDYGMEGLFGCSTSDHGEGKLIGQIKSGQCKLIEKLFIEGTKVTTQKGVQMALRNLLHLKKLGCEYVIEALANMHQNGLTRPKYGLTQLNLRQGGWLHWQMEHLSPAYLPYQHGALGLAVSMCSSLTCLDLKVGEEITDDDLLGLTVLEKLSDFGISTSENDCNFTFEGARPGSATESLWTFFENTDETLLAPHHRLSRQRHRILPEPTVSTQNISPFF